MIPHPAGLALALLLLAPVASMAQPAGTTRHALANGMRVLVREDAEAGVVAVSLQTLAGSRFEAPEIAGITNFLHRAMLRGTSRHTAERLVEAAEDIGGALDASADVDYSEVRGSALARHWETLLGLIAEVALTPTMPPDEVDKERRLILSQIQTRADNPFPAAFDVLLGELYPAHPYSWPPVGRREAIARVTRDALVAHHQSIYRPDRLVLAVSGRVEPRSVRRVAERLFGALPVGAPTPLPALPPPRPTEERRLLDRPARQAQILIGYVASGLAEADYAATKVLGALLGGGMAGRLFVELRDRLGLAYAVGVLSPTRAGPGPFVAYLGTARENVAAAEAAVRRELDRVRAEGATEDEVARAKAYVLGSLAMDRRSNARHAWYLAFFEVVGAGWDFPERHARAIEAVTPADVQAAARRHLTNPTTVVLQPR
ncbi:MAG: M16 family metallopeptidase [Candidatus Rokuibacteriota bacterium]